MVELGVLAPHPPIMVAGIGGPADQAKLAETLTAMREIDRIIAADPPETLVVFTPHGPVYQDAIVIYNSERLSGGLGEFGLDQTWSWDTDQELAEEIFRLGQAAGLPVYLLEDQPNQSRLGLDHGVLVPLSFFNPQWASQVELVVIPISLLPLEELYQFGALIREAVTELGRKTVVVASGDLSHCLLPTAPAGYDPRGAEFDQKFVALLQQGAVGELFGLDPVLLQKAAQCGFRSVVMMLGSLDTSEFQTRLLSYQGPFGVGYAVAVFQPQGSRAGLLPGLFAARRRTVAARQAQETPLVGWARHVVEAIFDGSSPRPVAGLEEFAGRRAGVFVSLKKFGELRGCIGTIGPTRDDIIEEVKHNAIAAATEDPRFEPVTREELVDLVYSVDVLEPAEPIAAISELDPKRYGVIVKRGFRQGLLLPNLGGIETAVEQVAIARQKAGIGPEEPVELKRFEVVRYN
jgi:AmmeMemoRadiSam system protein A/AmmeMemoRadiSam system protein B